MKKTLFGFLMVGLAFIALQVETAEAQISSDHPCYDIDPSNGGRDGHACWPKGEDPSVSVESSGERDVAASEGGAVLSTAVGESPKGDDAIEATDKNARDAEWIGGNTTKCAAGVNCKD
jgi:hypothetical protein